MTFDAAASDPDWNETDPGVYELTIASLADGASASRVLVARAAFAAAGQTLTNVAHVHADEFDPDAEEDDAEADTVVGPAADLRLEKAASVPALAQNGQLTYTLTAFNDGPSTAANVTIADTLPAGMSFVSASAGCDESAGTVTCDLGSIADGASEAVTITVVANANGTQVNTRDRLLRRARSRPVGQPRIGDRRGRPDGRPVDREDRPGERRRRQRADVHADGRQRRPVGRDRRDRRRHAPRGHDARRVERVAGRLHGRRRARSRARSARSRERRERDRRRSPRGRRSPSPAARSPTARRCPASSTTPTPGTTSRRMR